jgi:hypothetical protein
VDLVLRALQIREDCLPLVHPLFHFPFSRVTAGATPFSGHWHALGHENSVALAFQLVYCFKEINASLRTHLAVDNEAFCYPPPPLSPCAGGADTGCLPTCPWHLPSTFCGHLTRGFGRLENQEGNSRAVTDLDLSTRSHQPVRLFKRCQLNATRQATHGSVCGAAALIEATT